MADAIDVGQRSAQHWLVRMEAEGTVERTEAHRTSRSNRWRSTSADKVRSAVPATSGTR